jgi:hypothetical protein
VAGEEHLFESETQGESGFLFNRIESDSESLNNYQDMKGVFLAGSEDEPRNSDGASSFDPLYNQRRADGAGARRG